MLDAVVKYLSAIVVSLNFFMIGIEESSLYTILPKYLSNHSISYSLNYSISLQTNVSQGCYVQKPQYVIVSMIFLAKNLAQLVANLAIGGIVDKVNNYLILLISHVLGIIISLIYAFNNTVILYIVGRVLDAFLSSAVFICTFSIISKLFINLNIRGRYFGLANTLFFVSHSIGPVYGAEIDDKFGKSTVFLFLVPLWCLCSMLTFLLYWKIRNNKGKERKYMKGISKNELTRPNSDNVTNPISLESIPNETTTDIVKSDVILENSAKAINDNKPASKKMKIGETVSLTKILKDPYIIGCLFQVFLINLSIFSLPPTLPSWMAYKLCSTEVQQGLVWTFGFVGYISGVGMVILIIMCDPKLKLYTPIFAQVVIGVLLILLPFTRDWRLVFIPIIGMYFSVGIVEQVIFPLTTFLADTRFKSNYGTVSSLTSQSLTFSGVIGTLLSGYIAEKYGFHSLSFSLGVVTLLFSPISLIYRKLKS